MDAQDQSRFFSLAAELRNKIYALALSTEASDDGNIAFETSEPPSHNLSLTCRKAFREFHGMYEAASRSYYHDHTFTIDVASMQSGNPQSGRAVPRQIRSFRLDFDHLYIVPATVHLDVAQHGNWQARVVMPETVMLEGVERSTAPLNAHMADTAAYIINQLESLCIYDFLVWEKVQEHGRYMKGFTHEGLAILVRIFMRTFASRRSSG